MLLLSSNLHKMCILWKKKNMIIFSTWSGKVQTNPFTFIYIFKQRGFILIWINTLKMVPLFNAYLFTKTRPFQVDLHVVLKTAIKMYIFAFPLLKMWIQCVQFKFGGGFFDFFKWFTNYIDLSWAERHFFFVIPYK